MTLVRNELGIPQIPHFADLVHKERQKGYGYSIPEAKSRVIKKALLDELNGRLSVQYLPGDAVNRVMKVLEYLIINDYLPQTR